MSTRRYEFFLVAMLFGLQFSGCSSKSKPEPSEELAPSEEPASCEESAIPAIDYQGIYFLGNDGTGNGLYRLDRSDDSLTLLTKATESNEVSSGPHEFRLLPLVSDPRLSDR